MPRLPLSSKNPEINQYTGNKQHILLLNKSDLADPEVSLEWIDWFKKNTDIEKIVLFDAFDRRMKTDLVRTIHELNIKEKAQVKCLVCGIPNVGKSTVINNPDWQERKNRLATRNTWSQGAAMAQHPGSPDALGYSGNIMAEI